METAQQLNSVLEQQSWDVILSDFSLPSFGGFEALDVYHRWEADKDRNQKGREIPFIVVSGVIGEYVAVEIVKAGASDYVMKSQLTRLVPAIQRELRDAKTRWERKRSEAVQSILYRIAQAANANVPLEEFYAFIQRCLSELIPADNFYIALYDAEKDEVSFPYYKDQYDALPEPRRSGRGLTEYLLRKGEPQVVSRQAIQQMLDNNEIDSIGTVPLVWLGVPLKDEKQIIGAVVVQTHEDGVDYADQELSVLNFMADQLQMLIYRKWTEKKLQENHLELSLAYDSTLEGWARALELREKETAGHSQRVTDLTLILAISMGMRGDDLIHVRRGALLHDIGKMGIPDSILLKPGPLTEDEWVTMQQHPSYAFELLSPIHYLKPALEIPYFHHERWNGSGYPHGLKEEDIPLAARIFAVVDVWDALTSNRPYRPAWPKESARNYLIENSGKLFDPKVIEIFLSQAQIYSR